MASALGVVSTGAEYDPRAATASLPYAVFGSYVGTVGTMALWWGGATHWYADSVPRWPIWTGFVSSVVIGGICSVAAYKFSGTLPFDENVFQGFGSRLLPPAVALVPVTTPDGSVEAGIDCRLVTARF
jgi:hypothetical protein